MNRVLLSLFLLIAVASPGVLWLTQMPLGIPGEWTWDRLTAEPDSVWNLIGAAVAAGLYVVVVRVGWKRLSGESRTAPHRVEVGAWLMTLVALAFAWLWVVQEASPLKNRLGKAAFVLYYPSSSGYFTKARYEEPSSTKLLGGYENLMRERDVLHVGTHPPGLFLVFHGLIAACEKSPALAVLLDATQPASFREACDVIATNSLRSKPPRPLLPLDRRVLWLATLLVMLSASLVVVPLFGVVRQTQGLATAWLTASFWPAVPAVAVFVPKSDVVYAFVGMMIVWSWLAALKRRSVVMALLAGLFAWCGLMCSLAFLPVFLFAALVALGGRAQWGLRGTEEEPLTLTLSPHSRGEGTRPEDSPLCVSSSGSQPSAIDSQPSPVQLRHVVAVAVVLDRGEAFSRAEHPFGGLAPARVSDFGFDVGFKAVLARVDDVPERAGRLARERDADDRLAALEAVLPRQDESHRGTVLFRERFAVDARREQRQFVRRFGKSQALGVGPREGTVSHAVGFGGTLEARELDELRVGGWLDHFDQFGQREAGPRDAHRPRLDTAVAIGSLFQFKLRVEVIETERHRLGAQSIDGDLPRRWFEVIDVEIRLLARRELVEVRVDRGGLLSRFIAAVLERRVPFRGIVVVRSLRDVDLSGRFQFDLVRFVFAATGQKSADQQSRRAETQ